MAVVMFAAISRSTSSTAAIGILFIPFAILPYGLGFFIFGCCLPDLLAWVRGKSAALSVWAKLRALVAIVLPVWGAAEVVRGVLLTQTVNRIVTMDAPGLEQFLETSLFKENRFALGSLALNPNATTALLERVAQMPDPALHRKMGSLWPVMPGNGKGLAVMRLVAMHKNVSESVLVMLSKSPDNYVLGDVLANPKTPASILRQSAGHQDTLIQYGLAGNPATPAEMLQKLAGSKDEYTRARVAGNLGTPVETLEVLSADNEWHVRRNVATNKNTPPTILEKLAQDPDERVSPETRRKAKAAAKRIEANP